jgi:hypothetical protein
VETACTARRSTSDTVTSLRDLKAVTSEQVKAPDKLNGESPDKLTGASPEQPGGARPHGGATALYDFLVRVAVLRFGGGR